ncbi:TPA: hypothetical protein ACH3X2_005859 [Trebouxia sp. C0005]
MVMRARNQVFARTAHKQLGAYVDACCYLLGCPLHGSHPLHSVCLSCIEWLQHVQQCGISPADHEESFFVGDAAGRLGDFADSDKQFAAAVGIPFKLPEDIFGEGVVKKAAPTGVAEGGVNHNEALCTALKALADVYEAKGGNNVFAARAYNKTAGILAAYPKKVGAGKELKSVQGIGKGSMDKIDEFITTGTLAALSEAEAAVEGGDAPEKQKAVEGKAKDMAMKFL